MGDIVKDPWNARLVPEKLKESLMAYQKQGRPTGDFLRAVLENDLFGAVRRADAQNVQVLPAIVAWVHENIRPDSFGSSEKVARWLEGAKFTRLQEAEGEVIDAEVVEGELIEPEGSQVFIELLEEEEDVEP